MNDIIADGDIRQGTDFLAAVLAFFLAAFLSALLENVFL